MEEEKNLITVAVGFILLCKLVEKKKQKKSRIWMKNFFKNRNLHSSEILFRDLRDDGEILFRNFSRMSTQDFDYLLNMVSDKIGKCSTHLREAIKAKERLLLTLRFLATGDSYTSLMYLFRISKQSISKIIPEVCRAIVESLKDYVRVPQNENEWDNVARGFFERWNFPQCLGAIDGKHCVLQAPFNSGTDFFNYKGTFSIVLMAIADFDYCFIYADVGCQGRISDGGVFRNTSFWEKMSRNQLRTPLDHPLPHREITVPYVFIADDTFPSQPNLLKPFPGYHRKGSEERIYNYRLSRARRIIENVFGIMASVFRVLRKPILLQPDSATSVVLACIYLHNFLRNRKSSRNVYTPRGSFDREEDGELILGSWRQDADDPSSFQPLQRIGRRNTTDYISVRKEFAEYFSGPGAVEWQNLYS